MGETMSAPVDGNKRGLSPTTHATFRETGNCYNMEMGSVH